MEKYVKLYWKNYCIGLLEFKDGLYLFKLVDKNAQQCIEDGCPYNILCSGFKDKNYYIGEKIPLVFLDFDFSRSRKDLYKKYCISENDSLFIKLCKIAQKKEKNDKGFWLA